MVVCVDGSDAATNAAIWAIDEAVIRDVPLRIVHVIDVEDVDTANRSACSDQLRLDTQYAESSLRSATAAVEATDKPVKLETEILWGSVESALIEESSHASMICLGSVGIGPIARVLLGSTAATVAENAHCPVAIIRQSHERLPAEGEWVVVGVEDRADNEPVIELAMQEARLRHLPLMAVGLRHHDFGAITYDELDRRAAKWSQSYPDVRVRLETSPGGIAGFLAEYCADSVVLAVVGRVDGETVARIIGPHGQPVVRHGECSLLVVH
ncbi:universal stress protein [Mycolicibacterium wolinskyi]|uniref:universal stress protein n=1 Tax=Mycolicibacterium wolinskyi TaxID=59750 RepID=UPI0012FFD04C|nr:universal stress protein [Mycolicibacterium wolinskyi]